MIRILSLRHLVLLNKCKVKYTGVRTILSPAYLCEDAWQKRLENPLLKNLQMDQYFIEVDKKFSKELVSGVDIDLFANNVKKESQLDELEHLLFKFRRTKRSVEVMDSTVYATVRILLNFKQYESLLRVLNDRESYGIFPDMCSYNILMDEFLKQKLYKEAFQIATLMMLQEDFSNKISCLLGLYSCQMFLNEGLLESAVSEKNEEVKEEEDENEEMTYQRVPFLQNPFFDDHFDIVSTKHLIGKTFYLIGRETDGILGRTYQILGLVLYEKLDKALELLKSFSELKEPLFINEVVEKINAELDSISAVEERNQLCQQIKESMKNLSGKGKTVDGNLTDHLKSSLENIEHLEHEDINLQLKNFSDWEVNRENALNKQFKEVDKQRRLKIIQEKKEYLYWKEKELFFFENEEKILDELKEAEELTAKLESKKTTEDTYEPPEIVKKKTEKPNIYQRLANVKKL